LTLRHALAISRPRPFSGYAASAPDKLKEQIDVPPLPDHRQDRNDGQ